MKTTFHINHDALKVGSYMRNSGNGQRIMVVVDIKDDEVMLRSFGCTNKGDFAPAVKPRNIICEQAAYAKNTVLRYSGGLGSAHYYHVNRKDTP